MPHDVRIPVSVALRQVLDELKEPGQRYDDLLCELVEEVRTGRLMDRLDEIEATSVFGPLDAAADRG